MKPENITNAGLRVAEYLADELHPDEAVEERQILAKTTPLPEMAEDIVKIVLKEVSGEN